jgi:hypothetical protein
MNAGGFLLYVPCASAMYFGSFRISSIGAFILVYAYKKCIKMTKVL